LDEERLAPRGGTSVSLAKERRQSGLDVHRRRGITCPALGVKGGGSLANFGDVPGQLGAIGALGQVNSILSSGLEQAVNADACVGHNKLRDFRA
jgi:hypothetical protein